MPAAELQPEHLWLQKLLGEWAYGAEALMGVASENEKQSTLRQ